MTHAAEGLLQAYLDGEVTGEAEAELRAHLAACPRCDGELGELRAASALFSSSARLLGDAEPATPADQAFWRVRAQVSRRRLPGAGLLARAAGLVLLVSGGVMALVPESPLRRLAEGLFGEDRPAAAPIAEPPSPPAPVVTAPAIEPAEGMPGVILVPADGRVQLRVWSIAAGATVRVDLVDGVRVSVQTEGEADGVRFRSGSGRIEVMNLGTAHVSIQIPRSLPYASLEVDGRQWLFKNGDQLRLTGPIVEQSENTLVFRSDN